MMRRGSRGPTGRVAGCARLAQLRATDDADLIECPECFEEWEWNYDVDTETLTLIPDEADETDLTLTDESGDEGDDDEN